MDTQKHQGLANERFLCNVHQDILLHVICYGGNFNTEINGFVLFVIFSKYISPAGWLHEIPLFIQL